jgi:hypothetical protein
MEALKTVEVRSVGADGREAVRRYKRVPVDSRVTADRLLRIVGDAVWAWAAERGEGGEVRGALERVWREIDQLAENTSGCKQWKNKTRADFPYRTVCFSKTDKSCSLRNTPNKVSRLELMEGLRETLGLLMSWCHVEVLVREINGRVPRAKGSSKESIAMSTFISALWPYCADKAFLHLATASAGSVNADRLQKAMTLDEESLMREELEADAPVVDRLFADEPDQLSVVDSADL